ncbi:MAG TPA: L-seryl-tRNA(Sec) selenium transferase [Actinomycetota bacterium]|nr:L-seryl-tRNA(Sec) selenium transferase [Actinomycetota bacterium]
MARDARRTLPSVDALLRSAPAMRASRTVGRAVLKRTLTTTLAQAREAAARGQEPPEDDEILSLAIERAAAAAFGLTPVLNATGVVLHTNLGRAPLPAAAVDAVMRAAAGYTDLEVDRGTGDRGRRAARAELLLAALTEAEDALVVNNCAAALLLMLSALAKGRPVLVSRGELIEIGGAFRIPDIMRASGAKLVEVGTTNRTRLADYRAALEDRTAAILKVHPSNYRVVGFTAETSASDLAALASRHGIPFLYDVGSGLVETERGVAADEPSLKAALRAGADLVTASGDKLLGGPQVGCVVGRADLIAKLRKQPIARAVRVDKLQVAALEATLRLHAIGALDDVPVHAMLHTPPQTLSERAHVLAAELGGDSEGASAHVVRCDSVVGGGSLPGRSLPSWGVRLRVRDPDAFAARLRAGSPSVFARVGGDHVLLDVRTVPDDRTKDLARAVLYALEGGPDDDGA